MALSGYSGTPLVKKLGIKPGTSLGLFGAPDGFRRELVDLPGDVKIVTRESSGADLIVWFVTSKRSLEGRMPAISLRMGSGLWVAWPKKSSGVVTDVNEDVIRNAGLAHGLVDYKVCAINEIWSGLKFARRKK
jgi:hypothetical protein